MNKLSGYNVLVVDDDRDLREIVAYSFQMAGGEVDSAQSGKQALTMAKAKNYHFILSDMRMPDGDGLFLAEGLTTFEHKPLIFLYSGHNDVDPSVAHDLGVAKIFDKPFRIFEIIDQAYSLLSGNKAAS